MFRIEYCEACHAEAINPGVKINIAYHSCAKGGGFFIDGKTYDVNGVEQMGSDEGRFEIRESTGPMGGTVGTHRYALTELWPYHKRIKPINQLSTPHLRNIVELFANGEKMKQVMESEGNDEYRQLVARLINVRRELATRDSDIKHRVHNMGIRCAGMARKVTESNSSFYPLDTHEVYSVFKGAADLLGEVEATLAKTD